MKTDNILAIKEEMDINKNILRYLIIKTVKESTLIPKTIVFAKDDSSRKSKPKSAGITKKMDEAVKKKPTFVSEEYEEDLDKTIEKLIVE